MSLRITIFIQTILISILCGIISNLFWFSYILFLVIIGGLLVLFLYITNVASNEKFKPSKTISLIILTIIITIIWSLYTDKFIYYYKTSIWFNYFNKPSLETILIKFFNIPSNYIIIIIIIFLLLTIIITVKVTNIKKGALRQKY